MTVRNFRYALPAVLLLASATASAQVSGTGENQPELITKPYEYVSQKGEFKVIWPSGCGELMRRENDGDPDADPFERVVVFHVYCDQSGQQGVGCSVTAAFNLKGEDGGPAGPAQVVSRMEDQVKSLGVKIERQQPLRREMPDGTVVEGLEILAREPGGSGEAWLRGLLHEGDVFLLSAWNASGGLFADPEYLTFFNSFEPQAP